ncbi:RNA polymerase sigma factor (sigma-70 family) [Agromyces sp. 3263]|uniref:sigma-70 family RNA polymerase sigma factor n=1 Tax=Agromyces sp. 3263 TaxID=2817750 RepID=UPI0028555E25|nr:sigma-70 family RNA polymerase sigma factor [Agromyces sp. 3263]MDR6906799.1 RNA polymerase sigma factor (sigma-70 family) [Agromyces sp. 3263]
MPPLRTDLADSALIERTRGGDRSAYGELWQRHSASARTVARSYSSLDPDDLVAESFTRIYDAILAGGGPTGAFRPYLFTTIRNTASSWGRARHETNLETLESFEDPATSESASLDALDRSTTAQAFRSLPTRWQEVLWYTEVEGMSPQQVAPLVGMSANATAALAYRAREGLRQAWIQAHLRNAANEPECRWTIDRLGSYTRGRLRGRETARLEAHLDDCARCTIVAAEAREVGSRLALVLLPLAAGIGGATAYSAWLSQGAPAVDVALGAAGLPAVLGGHAAGASASGASGSGAGASGVGAGSAATGAGAAATAGVSGVAIGAGVGAITLAAVAVAAMIVVPTLASADQAPAAAIFETGTEAGDPEPPLPFLGSPVLPQPVPPHEPDAPPAPADPPAGDPVPVDAPAPAPVLAADPPPGGTTATPPGPTTGPTPEPEPVDDVALPPAFTADTAGGLVDPLLSGSGEAGASVTVAADDGRTWSTVADGSGAWSLVADALRAGSTTLTASQTDAAGNASPSSAPVTVTLSTPTIAVRRTGSHVAHGTIVGAAGADVELLLDGAVVSTVPLDGSGSARILAFGRLDAASVVEVRYAANGRTGPASTAVIER